VSPASAVELIRALGSADNQERAEAAIKLGQQKVSRALPDLRALSSDEDAVVSLAAMFACWQLGEDRIAIDRIFSALNSEDEALMQQAVHTVSAIGRPLVPKLKPFLDHAPEIAISALRLLEEIGGSEALDAIKATRSTDPEVSALVDEILEDWEDEP
jgi:HEAT repeat protein